MWCFLSIFLISILSFSSEYDQALEEAVNLSVDINTYLEAPQLNCDSKINALDCPNFWISESTSKNKQSAWLNLIDSPNDSCKKGIKSKKSYEKLEEDFTENSNHSAHGKLSLCLDDADISEPQKKALLSEYYVIQERFYQDMISTMSQSAEITLLLNERDLASQYICDDIDFPGVSKFCKKLTECKKAPSQMKKFRTSTVNALKNIDLISKEIKKLSGPKGVSSADRPRVKLLTEARDLIFQLYPHIKDKKFTATAQSQPFEIDHSIRSVLKESQRQLSERYARLGSSFRCMQSERTSGPGLCEEMQEVLSTTAPLSPNNKLSFEAQSERDAAECRLSVRRGVGEVNQIRNEVYQQLGLAVVSGGVLFAASKFAASAAVASATLARAKSAEKVSEIALKQMAFQTASNTLKASILGPTFFVMGTDMLNTLSECDVLLPSQSDPSHNGNQDENGCPFAQSGEDSNLGFSGPTTISDYSSCIQTLATQVALVGLPVGTVFGHQLLSKVQTLSKAAKVLNRPLTELEKKAVMNSHEVGLVGKNGGIAKVGNYSQKQITDKARILKQAGFSEAEVRVLMENSVVGFRGFGFGKDRIKNSSGQEYTLEQAVRVERSTGGSSNGNIIEINLEAKKVNVEFYDPASRSVSTKWVSIDNVKPPYVEGQSVRVPIGSGKFATGKIEEITVDGRAVLSYLDKNKIRQKVSVHQDQINDNLLKLGDFVRVKRTDGTYSQAQITKINSDGVSVAFLDNGKFKHKNSVFEGDLLRGFGVGDEVSFLRSSGAKSNGKITSESQDFFTVQGKYENGGNYTKEIPKAEIFEPIKVNQPAANANASPVQVFFQNEKSPLNVINNSEGKNLANGFYQARYTAYNSENQNLARKILDVSKDASEVEVKRAFIKKAQLYHPDKLDKRIDDFKLSNPNTEVTPELRETIRKTLEEEFKALNHARDLLIK